MEEDLDIKYANEIMAESTVEEIVLAPGDISMLFWDLIVYADVKWVAKLLEAYLMVVQEVDGQDLKQFFAESLSAFDFRLKQKDGEEFRKNLALALARRERERRGLSEDYESDW